MSTADDRRRAERFFDEDQRPMLVGSGVPEDALARLRKSYVEAALDNETALATLRRRYPHVERFVLEGRADPQVDLEDGGRAAIVDVDDGADGGWFVRVQSWREQPVRLADPAERHPVPFALAGRRVRVTIDILPED